MKTTAARNLSNNNTSPLLPLPPIPAQEPETRFVDSYSETHFINGKIITIRPIPNWPNYYAGDNGIIYSDRVGGGHDDTLRALKPQYNKKTHVWSVNLYNERHTYIRASSGTIQIRPKPIAIHRLVALAWLGPRPDNSVIDHIDNNTAILSGANWPPERRMANNRPDNLRFCSKKENMAYYREFRPLFNKGNNNSQRKLTEEDVRYIRSLKGKFVSKVIAAHMGIPFTTVRGILANRTWKHL